MDLIISGLMQKGTLTKFDENTVYGMYGTFNKSLVPGCCKYGNELSCLIKDGND
jgi:hypothetical protein